MQPVQLDLGIRIQDQCHFDNYFSGPNQSAVSLIKSVLSQSGFNGVYLWGQSQVGKSHCLQAACHAFAKENKRVCYFPLLQLDNSASHALAGLEDMDLVCVDDIQHVAGNPDWENALFALFNALRDRGAKLFIAAVCSVKQLGLSLPDLETRLQWDHIVHLYPLKDKEIVHALQLRCNNRGVHLSDETARYLLNRQTRQMGVLYELLERLIEQAIQEQRRLTIPFIRDCLQA